MTRWYVLVCMLFTLSAATWAQDTQAPADAAATLRARSNLVVLDVVVTDKNHQPVHGLKLSDFQVKEVGERQTIRNFEEHVATTVKNVATTASPLPPGVFTDYAPVAASGPVNVLLIDRLNTPVSDQSLLHNQLVAFLKKMKPGTQLAIFGMTSKLIYLQGVTADPALLLAAIESKKSRPRQSLLLADPTEIATSDVANSTGDSDLAAAAARFEAEEETFKTQERILYTLAAMSDLARYLSAIPGRKNVIWFSGAFPLQFSVGGDLTLPQWAQADMYKQLDDTADLLSKAQVAIYPVDARGVQSSPVFSAAKSGLDIGGVTNGGADRILGKSTGWVNSNALTLETMRDIAHATGGEPYVNTNDLAGAVEKAIANGSNYYTLSYTPSNPKYDGSFRKIEVALEEHGYTLSYRRGYHLDDARAKNQPQMTSLSDTPKDTTVDHAMLHGMPAPSQIVFKTYVGPGGEPGEQTVADNNVPPAGAKGPYRRYNVNVSASAEGLTYTRAGDGKYRVDLAFVTFVYTANGDLVNTVGNTVHATLSVPEIRAMVKTGFTFHQSVSVPVKGDYTLRIAVHDVPSDKVGAVEVPIDLVKDLPVVVAPSAPAK